MSKFKIGDYVKRIGQCKALSKLVGPPPYVVTAVSPNGYIQVNNWAGIQCSWYVGNFVLDDEYEPALPPVPEYVTYHETDSPLRTDSKLRVQHSAHPGYILLELSACKKDTQDSARTGIRLSADDVFNLCHDLRRMAMDIKRKGV
ncbi:hypothetical protein [Pectobacterium phage PPWS2]|uniref:Uncharacterized protein n=1 Tax=Pectobacterium phage PPWS2 TaxID=2153295 RepID=A0A3G9EM62_9CAUD|nr:hypothetical protein HOU58_gp15 [Pectobacterium phage PPWS2]BBD74647.1 hypothetical protein [Pectobacterium phage PPWS2]